MTEQKRAAGYIRVSSKEQTEGESLSTQRQSIRDFVKAQGWKLTDIYSDEGISGGSVKERHALLQCLYDGHEGKFDVLVIHRLSRLGRNARELLINHEELEKVGIQLRSISEGIDFGNKYGKAALGMLAIVAELERDIIREQMLENRIARGKKGIPTSGNLPFGRKFNRETNQWELDPEAARLIQWAADEYLKGGSLRDIAYRLKTRHDLPLSYTHLLRLLKDRCGDTWTVRFKNEVPIVYKIPRLLDDLTIQRVKERIEYNKTNNRKDVRKYVLSGFIRCEKCGKTLSGQIQTNRFGGIFKYYNHPRGKYEECKAFNSIPLEQIENAVFQTIFENIADVPSFEKAIAASLPDEDLIKSLQSKVKGNERELKRIRKKLDQLVDLALSGTLAKETIKSKEQALLRAKTEVSEELEANRDRLSSLPDLKRVKQEAETIRLQLLEDYSGPERLKEMSFDEKKALLHWLFDGKDRGGKPYGIYVNKKGGRLGSIDYFMYGRITGLRTLKGDDINFMEEIEENQEDKVYKTTNPAWKQDIQQQ